MGQGGFIKPLTQDQITQGSELYYGFEQKKQIIHLWLGERRDPLRDEKEVKERLDYLKGPDALTTNGSEIRALEQHLFDLGEVINLLGLRE